MLDTTGTWVVDGGNHRIQRLTLYGAPISTFGSTDDSIRPRSIAHDSDGHLYVVDVALEHITIFDQQGRLMMRFSGGGSGAGALSLPAGLFIDGEDHI